MEKVNKQIETCVSDKKQQDALKAFITNSLAEKDSKTAVRENKICVLYSPRANGKSTLIQMIEYVGKDKIKKVPSNIIYGDSKIDLDPLQYRCRDAQLLVVQDGEGKINTRKLNTYLTRFTYHGYMTRRIIIGEDGGDEIEQILQPEGEFLNISNMMVAVNDLSPFNDIMDQCLVITFDKIFEKNDMVPVHELLGIKKS